MSSDVEMSSLVGLAQKPATVERLIAWFEENFLCMVGVPRAYFQIQTGPDSSINVVYDSYVTSADFSDDVEARLVECMYQDFSKLLQTPAHYTALFWRLPARFDLKNETVPSLGDMVATLEDVQDNRKPQPDGPGFIQGNDGNWYRLLGTKTVTKLRTRLAIPAMLFIDPLPQFATAHSEGGFGPMYKLPPS